MDKTSDPATGVVSEGIKHVIYVYEKDVTPEEKTTTDTPVKTSTSKVNAEKVTVNKATVLPQTGDSKDSTLAEVGLLAVALAGGIGLAGYKKKKTE